MKFACTKRAACNIFSDLLTCFRAAACNVRFSGLMSNRALRGRVMAIGGGDRGGGGVGLFEVLVTAPASCWIPPPFGSRSAPAPRRNVEQLPQFRCGALISGGCGSPHARPSPADCSAAAAVAAAALQRPYPRRFWRRGRNRRHPCPRLRYVNRRSRAGGAVSGWVSGCHQIKRVLASDTHTLTNTYTHRSLQKRLHSPST